MKLEIDDNYLDWVLDTNPDVAGAPNRAQALADYVNAVLEGHQASWEDLTEEDEGVV